MRAVLVGAAFQSCTALVQFDPVMARVGRLTRRAWAACGPVSVADWVGDADGEIPCRQRGVRRRGATDGRAFQLAVVVEAGRRVALGRQRGEKTSGAPAGGRAAFARASPASPSGARGVCVTVRSPSMPSMAVTSYHRRSSSRRGTSARTRAPSGPVTSAIAPPPGPMPRASVHPSIRSAIRPCRPLPGVVGQIVADRHTPPRRSTGSDATWPKLPR